MNCYEIKDIDGFDPQCVFSEMQLKPPITAVNAAITIFPNVSVV